MAGAVVMLVLCAGAVGGVLVWRSNSTADDPATASLDGLVDYRKTQAGMLTRNHQDGTISYPVRPPVGGNHASQWQNCEGDVYTAPIPDESAVHSLEHGAVWITYRPGLAAADVGKLAARVTRKDYTLMSPYPGLDGPVSLQAWGYRLSVPSADDKRIDAFLRRFRKSASIEPGATCSLGATTTR